MRHNRRTCARLCHLAGGELNQIQFLLGHISIQTTERYLGCKQKFCDAVHDGIDHRAGIQLLTRFGAADRPPLGEGYVRHQEHSPNRWNHFPPSVQVFSPESQCTAAWITGSFVDMVASDRTSSSGVTPSGYS